jgi:hypothetical protein
MDQRGLDRLQVVNRTYLFRKNFPQTLRSRAGLAALLVILCVHRVLNREWSGLHGLVEGAGTCAGWAPGLPDLRRRRRCSMGGDQANRAAVQMLFGPQLAAMCSSYNAGIEGDKDIKDCERQMPRGMLAPVARGASSRPHLSSRTHLKTARPAQVRRRTADTER